MSPIDIVPLEENAFEVDLESSMDIVPNHRIYHSERTDSTIMFSNMSTNPLVAPSASKQTLNHTKQSHVSFQEVCSQVA